MVLFSGIRFNVHTQSSVLLSHARAEADVGVFVAWGRESVMRVIFDGSEIGATGNHPQDRGAPTKLSGRKFGAVAKLLWPGNTAKTVAAIANRSHRTAERWLSGEFEPPAVVIAAAVIEMTREL